MYSLFELAGSEGARLAAAATGSLITTAVLMISTAVPATPASAHLALGALA